MKERSDQEWVRLLKQGDAKATKELWVLIFTYGVNMARRYCWPDEMRAQDVGHEGAEKAFIRVKTRGVFQFRFGGSFRGYCHTITANEVKRVLKRQPKPAKELPEEVPEKPLSSRNAEEIRALLQPCLDQLASREREVIEWLCFQELSNQEAAEKLGITCNNVYRVKHRSLKKLQKCMKARGFGRVSDVV